jgi:hypothetical protein
VITVNPKHRQFYTKVLGYVPLGPCRAYDRVQGAPAEAFLLDLDHMQANAPGAFREMFGEPLPRSVLTAPKIPPVLVRSFAQMSSQTRGAEIEAILRELDENGSPRRWAAWDRRSRLPGVGSPAAAREGYPVLQTV